MQPVLHLRKRRAERVSYRRHCVALALALRQTFCAELFAQNLLHKITKMVDLVLEGGNVDLPVPEECESPTEEDRSARSTTCRTLAHPVPHADIDARRGNSLTGGGPFPRRWTGRRGAAHHSLN